MAASLVHPNVATVYHVGEDAGELYMAMEYIPSSFHALIFERGALPVSEAVELIRQVALALQAAHQQGIVHRDIKPQNILLAEGNIPKVADFGIARAEDLSAMAATGTIMGTPHYMSPEQCRGERADIRSDIYALGVVFYQMLTGEQRRDAPGGPTPAHRRSATPCAPGPCRRATGGGRHRGAVPGQGPSTTLPDPRGAGPGTGAGTAQPNPCNAARAATDRASHSAADSDPTTGHAATNAA